MKYLINWTDACDAALNSCLEQFAHTVKTLEGHSKELDQMYFEKYGDPVRKNQARRKEDDPSSEP